MQLDSDKTEKLPSFDSSFSYKCILLRRTRYLPARMLRYPQMSFRRPLKLALMGGRGKKMGSPLSWYVAVRAFANVKKPSVVKASRLRASFGSCGRKQHQNCSYVVNAHLRRSSYCPFQPENGPTLGDLCLKVLNRTRSNRLRVHAAFICARYPDCRICALQRCRHDELDRFQASEEGRDDAQRWDVRLHSAVNLDFAAIVIENISIQYIA